MKPAYNGTARNWILFIIIIIIIIIITPPAGRFPSKEVLKSLDAQDSRSLGLYKSFWLKTGVHQAKVLFKKGYTVSVSFYYKQMHNMSYGSNKMPLSQCSNHTNHSS